MENQNLNNIVLNEFEEICSLLEKEEKSKIHYNSVDNFIYHLVKHPQLNKKEHSASGNR